jgi:hypothetical protein
MLILSDQDVTNSLLHAGGILTQAARHLTEQLGQPVTRSMLAERLEGSRVLQAIRQIAEQRAIERSIAAAKQRRKDRRSASMKASWAERKAQADRPAGSDMYSAPDELEHVDVADTSNAPARPRASRGPVTAATVQAARDRRLCGAKTRGGTPCVRRVVPGRNRCPNHGGASRGPISAEGKARIGAIQRARWERWRREGGPRPNQRSASP